MQSSRWLLVCACGLAAWLAGCSGLIASPPVGTDDGTAQPDPDPGSDPDPDPDPGSDPDPDPGSDPDPDPGSDPDPDPGSDPDPDPDPELAWHAANLTYFTSYPDPGSDECVNFNGCQWAGYFAFVTGQKSEDWVMDHNIVAVHAAFADEYALKTLRLRDGEAEIDVTVYDMCSDSDCDGCCTANSSETGFLIDIESYTAERFGTWGGVVEWACLDCD